MIVKPKPIRADLAARRVLMSCYLYYTMDTNVLNDHEYDQLVNRVITGWDKLDELRRWQLGSPDKLHASGVHVWLTAATIGAAQAWGDFHNVQHTVWRWPRVWKTRMDDKLRYASVSF